MDNFIDEIRELKRRVEELEKRNIPSMSIPDPLSVSKVKTDQIEEKTSGGGVTFLSQVNGVIPVGSIFPFAGSSAPSGFLLCDGSAVSRTTYSALFSVIGTTYGAGNGSTTFNLPNLKGRIPVGLDTSQSEFNTLGKTGGAKTHTLTIDEMPSHTHMQNPYTWQAFTGQLATFFNPGSFYGINCFNYNLPTQSTGNSQPHNNLQPYITINYIIKF